MDIQGVESGHKSALSKPYWDSIRLVEATLARPLPLHILDPKQRLHKPLHPPHRLFPTLPAIPAPVATSCHCPPQLLHFVSLGPPSPPLAPTRQRIQAPLRPPRPPNRPLIYPRHFEMDGYPLDSDSFNWDDWMFPEAFSDSAPFPPLEEADPTPQLVGMGDLGAAGNAGGVGLRG